MYANHQYQEAFSEMLSRYDFELFASISLGIPYSPQALETRLRQVLKRVTRTPYHCGFYGIYTDCGSPHTHLLLTSASEPLDPSTVKWRLSQAFKRKEQPRYHQTEDDAENVERDHCSSLDVQCVYNLQGAAEYLCLQYPDMHQNTGNEIFGNIKALNRRRRPLSDGGGSI